MTFYVIVWTQSDAFVDMNAHQSKVIKPTL